jgi:DNA repair protein RadC
MESRVRGPFYVGQKENYSEEYASMNLRQWQKELFEFILVNKNNSIIREHKII